MTFRPELAAKVMAGEKTVTRRLVSDNPRSPWWRACCSLVVGKDYAVCPGRGQRAVGRVRIISVRREPIGERLSADEARKEGFGHPDGFAHAWSEMHGDSNGDWDAAALVWRVEFEAL